VKANKEVIIDEIVKYIKRGMATEKIRAVICSKFQLQSRAFYNNFKKAEEKHIAKQQAIKKKTEALELQEAIGANINDIITEYKAVEILAKIANDEKKRPADIIAAIKQLGIMLGWEKPTKTDLSISGDIKATVIKLFEDQEPLHE
jgi:predicted DNA-binding protein